MQDILQALMDALVRFGFIKKQSQGNQHAKSYQSRCSTC